MRQLSAGSAAAAIVPVLAALAAHAGCLGGGFVFDDGPAVRENAAIHRGDWWAAAFGPDHSPVANRPLTCLSLAIDHALHGLAPAGYHLTNLLLHALNALLVAAVVYGVLRARNLAARFAPARAQRVALAVATLWAVHPLGVDAVAYVTQRTTLLMSTCLLAAMAALLRAARSPRPRRWHLLAMAATALGMASKEEMVAAPILLVLFDRAFLQPDWAAVRARARLHLGLAAGWLVLAACVALGPHNATVGYATEPRASAFEWLLSEAPAVAHYARLALWPWPLRGAYDWPLVRDPAAVLLPAMLVLAALAATAIGFRRRPWWGFLGAFWFLLLAPTSSVLPIVTEIVAERRAYLPMLAVLAPLLLGLETLAGRTLRRGAPVFCALVLALVVAATFATRAHVRHYRDETAFWLHARSVNDCTNGSFLSGIILSNHGFALHRLGRHEEAHAACRAAMECTAPTPVTRMQYAVTLAEVGEREAATRLLREICEEHPRLPDASGHLAILLLRDLMGGSNTASLPAADPRLPEIERLLRAAVAGAPGRAVYHNTLGWLLAGTGRTAEAEAAYGRAVHLDPARAEPAFNLARLLLENGRVAAAREAIEPLLAARPGDVAVRWSLADLFLRHGARAFATWLLEDVLRIEPGHTEARAALARLRAELR